MELMRKEIEIGEIKSTRNKEVIIFSFPIETVWPLQCHGGEGGGGAGRGVSEGQRNVKMSQVLVVNI